MCFKCIISSNFTNALHAGGDTFQKSAFKTHLHSKYRLESNQTDSKRGLESCIQFWILVGEEFDNIPIYRLVLTDFLGRDRKAKSLDGALEGLSCLLSLDFFTSK